MLETENTQLKAGGGAHLLKAQEKEIKSLRKETEHLEDQLDEKQQIVKLTMDNMKLVQDVTKLEKKLENKKKEFDQLEQVLHVKGEKLQSTQKSLEEREAENKTLKELG